MIRKNYNMHSSVVDEGLGGMLKLAILPQPTMSSIPMFAYESA